MMKMKFNIAKSVAAAVGIMMAVSCTEIKFGDAFLGDAPESSGSTTETMFSSQYYADQVLTRAYQGLPYGLTYKNSSGTNVFRFGVNPIECITDLCQGLFSNNQNASAQNDYYSGSLSANSISSTDAYVFGSTDWTTIKYAWIYLENIDKVPDMTDDEKDARKAEAKTVLAVAYFNMLRNVGGVPWISHSISTDDDMHFPRQSFATSVENIVALLDEAIAEPKFEWKWDELNDGRMSRAAAMALKFKVLQFAASPMFNSDTPWHPAADQYTWYGNYDAARWQAAADAGKAFFNEVNRRGEYSLIRATATTPEAYRAAYRKAYYNRGGSEVLISIRKGGLGSDVYGSDSEASIYQTRLYIGPTLNYVDMFPWADGTEFPAETFNWENPSREPFFADNGKTLTRDPRLYENVAVPGDTYFNGNAVPTYQGHPNKQQNTTGFMMMKFILQQAGDRRNVLVHWPHTRLAEIMLGYAEVLNEVNGGPTDEAYEMINGVRARVGLSSLSKLNQSQFREAVLRERACEFGFEEVRWFDLIRWNRADDFRKTLYGLEVAMKSGESADNAKNFTYKKVALAKRAWVDNWNSKWYLSPIPQTEINKNYGMTQNPGW